MQPIWGRSREELPAQHVDVYQDYRGFLEQVTAWADQNLSSARNGFAINAIRKACKIFGGVGVYTVLELFFRAGKSNLVISLRYNILTVSIFRTLTISV